MDFIGASTSLTTQVSSNTVAFLGTSGIMPYFAMISGIMIALLIVGWIIETLVGVWYADRSMRNGLGNQDAQ